MKTGSIRRNYLLGALGLAAISMFTLALPGTALAFVNSCPGGTVAVNSSGDPYCSGELTMASWFAAVPIATLRRLDLPPFAPGFHFSPSTFPPFDRVNQGSGGDTALDSAKALAELAILSALTSKNGGGQLQDNHLGMYVSSNGGMSSDVTLGGGGYSLRNSGVSISDTAGLIAPGTNSASYHENGGRGGLSGTYDASRFVGSNQHLFFNGAFDYTNSSTNFGGAGAGSSINGENYSFTGTALYVNYQTYVALKGSYQFGNNSEFNSSNSSTGTYRSDGYDIDATVGHIFWLWNTMSQTPASRMAVKAPPRTSDGYAIGLDLSGHLGYRSDVARGFTDSAGFVFGNERVQGGETGLEAKLLASVQNYGVIWQPYVAGTVDWRFGYSHIANFPGQAALATGDALTFEDATTFVGAKAGFDVKMSNGWIVGANGFYDHSSDTDIVGGKAYVKIPFGATDVSARY